MREYIAPAMTSGLLGFGLAATASVYTPQLSNEEQRNLEPNAANKLIEQRREEKEHRAETSLDAAGRVAEDRERGEEIGRQIKADGRASTNQQRTPPAEKKPNPDFKELMSVRYRYPKERPRGRGR